MLHNGVTATLPVFVILQRLSTACTRVVHAGSAMYAAMIVSVAVCSAQVVMNLPAAAVVSSTVAMVTGIVMVCAFPAMHGVVEGAIVRLKRAAESDRALSANCSIALSRSLVAHGQKRTRAWMTIVVRVACAAVLFRIQRRRREGCGGSAKAISTRLCTAGCASRQVRRGWHVSTVVGLHRVHSGARAVFALETRPARLRRRQRLGPRIAKRHRLRLVASRGPPACDAAVIATSATAARGGGSGRSLLRGRHHAHENARCMIVTQRGAALAVGIRPKRDAIAGIPIKRRARRLRRVSHAAVLRERVCELGVMPLQVIPGDSNRSLINQSLQLSGNARASILTPVHSLFVSPVVFLLELRRARKECITFDNRTLQLFLVAPLMHPEIMRSQERGLTAAYRAFEGLVLRKTREQK